jgi:hypothetical protein
MTWRIACAYGREAFMRSCALRIFDAETISSARVTLRVFCTLLILSGFLFRLPSGSLLVDDESLAACRSAEGGAYQLPVS